MSSISSAAAQQKFTALRRRLDQLGYRQPLGIESLPLVERLFADLVHTTESLRSTKLQSVKSPAEKGNLEAAVEPYRSDNAKLVKENNELHQQLIKVQEELEVSSKELRASLRKVEHENADLRFLNNQYVHKVRALEKESKSKTDRILQLQEKNFHAVVQTPGGKKKNIPFRRQRMELETMVPDASSKRASPLLMPEDPYVADLLKMADDKIAELTNEVAVAREERDGTLMKIDSFRKQVETRDVEIDRLSRMLEGGRPYDVVALEARNRSNERLISHLNIQIDFLQQKNADLQAQLDDALSRLSAASGATLDLDARNSQLERSAHRMEAEKEVALAAADKNIFSAKDELERSRTELESLDFRVARLKASEDRLLGEMAELKKQLAVEQAERADLDDLVTRVQNEKQRLAQRVNKLTINERDLVLELDRAKCSHRNGMVKKKPKGPSATEKLIKGIEEERDYWKGEVETLQKLLKTSRARVSGRSRSVSPTRRSPTRGPRSIPSTPTKSPSRARGSRNTSPFGTPLRTKTAAQLELMVHALEQERDHFKRECEVLKSINRSRPSSRAGSPSRIGSPVKTVDEVELERVTKERDELQTLLDKFERHMAEVQANVKILTTERDNVNIMYEETKEELNRLRRDVIRSPKSPKTSLAAQAVLRRVENERDDALSELTNMSTERDSLRERLKIATETHLSDRARLEQRTEDLQAKLLSSERELSETEVKVKSAQRVIESLEKQLREQQVLHSSTQDEASQYKTTATQMRLLAQQAERSLQEQTHNLNAREAELRNADEKIAALETRIATVSAATQGDLDEMTALRTTISALDREKDALQAAVDEKTEKVVQLEEALYAKERSATELQRNVAELESAVDRNVNGLGSKEREIASLKRQLDAAEEEVTEAGRGREVALRENRRLQDDLATMTRENQAVNQDLADAIAEREQLNEQVQDYIVEVKRIEEMLAAKERERSNLLEQYRTLSMEAEKYETATHQLESEGSNLRLEIMTRDGEFRRLRDRIDEMERKNDDLQRTLREYEAQVSALTTSVAAQEEAARHADQEKHSILQDLSAVRDLCTKLEATKDSLQRQLAARTLDQEKLSSVLENMKQETALLRAQVGRERESSKSLETLLHSNREKEFHAQLTQQEKDAEIQLLKDRLSISESKLDSQSRELSALRTQNIEIESEVDRMKRTLTNERFERERAVQELRRHGLAPPVETGRLSRISAGSPSRLTPDPTAPGTKSPRKSGSPYQSLNGDEEPQPAVHTGKLYGTKKVNEWMKEVGKATSSKATGAISKDNS